MGERRKLTEAERDVIGISAKAADGLTVSEAGKVYHSKSPMMLGFPQWTPGEAWMRWRHKTPESFEQSSKRRMNSLIDILTDYVSDAYHAGWEGSHRMALSLRDLADQVDFLHECARKGVDPREEAARRKRERWERHLAPQGAEIAKGVCNE